MGRLFPGIAAQASLGRCALLLALLLVPALAPGVAAAQGLVNQVSNGDFDLNVLLWTPLQGYMSIEHSSEDVDGDEESGSAIVRFEEDLTLEMAGQVAQCVGVVGGEELVLSGSVFIPSGQQRQGAVGLRVAWFESDDCSGFFSSVDFGPSTSAEDFWVQLGPSVLTAPGRARSAQVQLQVGKTVAGGTRYAHFDAVFLPEPEPPVRLLSVLAAVLLLLRLRGRGPAQSRGAP